jgi:hypothetical protein
MEGYNLSFPESQFHCHIIHHKFHKDRTSTEPGYLWWEEDY